MADPLSADRLLAALRTEGLTVVEVGNWRTHNRNHKGSWGPVHGVMIHHTVTKGTTSTVRICRDGYSGLPGPLCHGVIAKDGSVHLISAGRANHAGLGDGDVLRAVIAERELPADNEANTDGNRHFYGFECENLGDGKDPWPAVQLEAIERVSAAICRAHGWNERSVIGHLEWQPGKVDPRGFSMDTMRGRIRRRLAGAPAPVPTPPKEDNVMEPVEVWAYRNKRADEASVARGDGRIPDAYGYLVQTHSLARALIAKADARPAVDLSGEQLTALANAVAAHPALADQIAERVAEKIAARLAN
ncbi:N-acetylmuramoyl-L-alanine amidase [Streptomyces sp. PR69]|uniref:N-acetylmuramoyl-L-alanine amidase n=1 Tax=Streptomyces sp. PR69 TaxID=2984950 RepID=UPI0022641C09|nr:N-acetylmuramoyl-L-alanine amidase [Streptomyces sp. PR69]